MDLQDAQRLVHDGMKQGIECPCCRQFCKIYARKFNSNMAMFLCSLVREYYAAGAKPVHYSKCKFRGRDYPYIAGWELAGTSTANSGQKRTSGFWYPSQKGVDFVKGQITIPSHALYFNQQLVGFSDDQINIRQAFSTPFTYQQLMEGVIC